MAQVFVIYSSASGEPPSNVSTQETTTSTPATIKTSLPNPSLQVTADQKLKLQEAPVYAPGHGEVLLHIKATGVCGSDIHFWKAGRIGSLIVEGDCILGHEAAGIVLQCGVGVTTLQPGDRVAIEPGLPCNTCFLCTQGRYNLCSDVKFSGVYPTHGTIQRYKTHPARYCHKIPSQVSYAEGALLEPLSVVMHAIKSTGLSLGRGALICGAGPIGLMALAAARASGAHPLVITDLEPGRLAFAEKFVPAAKTYLVDRKLDAKGNAERIRVLFDVECVGEHGAPETVLECTGVESSVITAAYAVRRGGKVMVIGVGREVMNNLPFMHLSDAEIELKFSNRYCDTWPAGLQCLAGGILNLKPMVSHTFPLEKALDALHTCGDLSNGSIKVQIIDDVEDAL
ncbi:Sorbitol dehydrogenase [Pyrenophora teres f. maculata]|nr:Sorbitol dehydrogenase [Pyrenophora teres f. maculata]